MTGEGAGQGGEGLSPDEVRGDWRAVAVLVAGLVLCGVLLMWMGRDLTFFADEWTFALDRRDWDVDSLLASHNGHLVLIPAFVYKVLFEVVGFAQSWPYRLILFGFHAACVVLIYLIARKRFGPWLALAPAGLILLPGASNDNLLGAFQIAFIGSLAFGLAALLCLDREERRFDIAAAALIGLSISCSAIGFAFAVGILAELVLTRGKRPRLYVVLIPLALYVAWLIGFQTSGENAIQAGNITSVPRYDVKAAAKGFAGFGNLPLLLGGLLLLATSGWLGIKLLKERGLPARAFVGIVAALVFWTLAALARAQFGDADASRYIYPSMVFIMVAVMACLPPVRRVSRPVGAVLAAIVVLALVNSLAPLSDFTDYRAREEALARAEISAANLAAQEGDPWLETVRDLDYPTLSAREIMALPVAQQLRADQNLTLTDHVTYATATALELRRAEPARVRAGQSMTRGAVNGGGARCTRLTPEGRGAVAVVPLPPDRDLLLLGTGGRAPEAQVRMRRLSTRFQPLPVEMPPDALSNEGEAGVVQILDDRIDLPWYARIELSGPVGVCLVPPLA